MAVAKPWPSAIISRINESGVGRGAATSPTTLEKSKLSSASYLRASCCMRLLSARQAMCRNLRPRFLDRERDLGFTRDGRSDLPQLRSAAQRVVDEEAMNKRVDAE